MNYKIIIFCFYLTFLSSCTSCKDESVTDDGVIWKTRICGSDLIGDEGLGYPIYKNTVVFHSTPVANDNDENSILYGLDSETGKEKWHLTNADFAPKKELRFHNYFYPYQKDNIVVASDCVIKDPSRERFIYGIDIEKGKVLWLTQFPNEYTEMGDMLRGAGKYAYVNAFNESKFSLLKTDIQTGELTSAFDLTNKDLPIEISSKNPAFFNCFFTSIYQKSNGDDMVACSLISQYEASPSDLLVTLYIYNLTQNTKVYSTPVALKEGSNAWILYHEGKILIGKSHTVYCYDAFENKKYWEKSVILNDGVGSGSGNDEIIQVLAYDNLALVYCVDRLVCIDIYTGNILYNVPAAGSNTANVIDGIIYQREHSDLQMRDPKTGKELKRVATPTNAQAFSSSRPNGKDGKIYIHSYSDAYCIKAWGK